MKKKERVKRTRNNNTWTESMYWSAIRSGLRLIWMRHWQPRKQVLLNARRECKGKGRQKYEYKCAITGKYFKAKEVEVDHLKPNNTLRCKEDLVPFIDNLLTEDINDLQVISKVEHKKKTNLERKSRKK